MVTIAENKGVASAENFPPACPVETTLHLIGNKWKVFVLRELLPGVKRFGELQKSIPHISQKVLTQNLRAMEGDGLIAREVFPEVPPRVEYSLTELGQTLRPVIAALWDWGLRYKERE
jgi:DNA-binding HxlR family transcriptional regulator